MSARLFRRIGVVLGACLAAGVLWQVTVAEAPKEKGKAAAGNDLTQTLGGADRYLTHVSTDKPIYRPGETLYVRGVLLHHATRKPLPSDQQAQAVVEIKGPKGDSVASGTAQAQDSTLGFSWQIPKAQAGGEYTIAVSYPYTGQPPAERKFDVRAYRAPRLKTQIKFIRDGYGPGDEVLATLHADRAEGGVPSGSEVTVIARVDGAEAFRGKTTIDAKGNCQARFKLPPEIRRGEGTLAMVIEDGGAVETASKTIPILLQTVDLTMYPEGGDLVAGRASRVYFEAFTPAKKPADLAGVVVDASGTEVATFRSEHEGRGRFAFTPKAGGKYVLKITEPAGIKTEYPLPEAKPQGVVLSSRNDVTAKGSDVRLALAATSAGTYRITLRQREREVANKEVKLSAGQSQEITLSPGDADGVLMATVTSGDGQPLAERLVFRQPARSVQVKLTANARQYVPGGKAKITVQTLDESGKPVSAVVGVAATDDSVLEMIDKREQAPRLPAMVLLEGEVKELADAHVYLDPDNEQAPLAADLLLGTQGWRRFALVDMVKFSAAHGDLARRVLAMKLATAEDTRFWRFADFAEVDRLQAIPEGAPRAPAPPAAAVPVEAFAQAKQDDKPARDKDGIAEQDEVGAVVAEAKKELFDREAVEARGGFGRGLEFEEEVGQRADLQKALGGRGRRKQIAGGGEASSAIRNDFAAVRVYAHQVRSQRKPGERVDFAETLYWSSAIRTDEKGQASVEFGLNDSVTSFRVLADAITANGGLGASSIAIDSVEPFYLEPKLPLEVTSGDVIRLPIGLVNATQNALSGGALKYQMNAASLLESGSAEFKLPAGGRVRHILDLNIGQHVGETTLTLEAAAGPHADKVTRTIMVRPLGFPMQLAYGGLVSPGATVTHDLAIPDTLVKGSLEARVVVHPTPLASMNEALAGLIQQPSGCFEQTSSTVYPLVMAQQYFMSHEGVDPALIEKSSQILQTGYERLLGFESKSGGFEWFGGDPGHDALTAYGLLEFTDMAAVRQVDPTMLERTRKWLLDQRDGKGGYLRKTHTLHSWVAEPECANSYNTWALLEAGVKEDLSTEVKWIRDAAEKTQNTYVVALAANVLALAGDKEGENHLLDKLAGKQQADGALSGATTSVIGSGGEALTIETTALAVLAWLKNPRYASNVEQSIKFLAESCKAGRYGSTQSTILALRAIVAYDKSRAKPTQPGSLQLVVDGKPIGEPVAFDQETTGVIELPGLAHLLSEGKHQVQVTMMGGSPMPYSVTVKYHSVKPDSSDDCKLHLEVSLRDKKIDEGGVTEAQVVVVNRTNEAIPTPIAIVGIPGGLEVRHDQLKELVKASKIDAYEVLGREVVLYWRSLDKEARVELPLSLVAAVPGTYTGPASRAYLYYTDEHKQWVDGVAIEIAAKE